MSTLGIQWSRLCALAFRFVSPGAAPDHDKIAIFQCNHPKDNFPLIHAFLRIAKELGFLEARHCRHRRDKDVGGRRFAFRPFIPESEVAEARLRGELDRLLQMAEGAGNRPIAEGLNIPAAIAWRDTRIKRLAVSHHATEARRAGMVIEHRREQLVEHLAKTKKAVADGKCPLGPRGSRRRRYSRSSPTTIRVFCPTMRLIAASLSRRADGAIVGSRTRQRPNYEMALLRATYIASNGYGTPGAALADNCSYRAESIP